MFPQLIEQDIYKLSTSQLVPLGTKFVSDQSRNTYKYVAFGNSAALTSGVLLVAPVAPTNSTGLALATANTTTQLSFGSKSVQVVNGATAVTANQFADGTLEVLGVNGYSSYTISGNTADASGGATITVSLSEPLRNTTALVAGTNTVNLRQNAALNASTSLTVAEAVGVTILPVPYVAGTNNYGWVQVGGPTVVFATTGTKGLAISQDTAGTAGYVVNAAAGSENLGVFQESVVSGLATVNLSIA